MTGRRVDHGGTGQKKPVPGIAPVTTTHENSKRILSSLLIGYRGYRPGLPIAESQANRIRTLVQSFLEHAFGCKRTVQAQQPQLQFPDIGYFPGVHIKIVVCLILPCDGAFELLPGGVFIADTGAHTKSKIISPMRRKVKIKHNWDSGIICGQFVFAIIDRIHENLGGVLLEFNIFFISVVVQLDAQAVLQIDHMFDHIEPLHEHPDIDIDGLARAQAKPVLVGAGSKCLGRCRGVIRLIVVVSKSEVEYEPVSGKIRRVAPVVLVIDVHCIAVFFIELSIFDDDQVPDTDRVPGCCSISCGIVLCMTGQGQAQSC